MHKLVINSWNPLIFSSAIEEEVRKLLVVVVKNASFVHVAPCTQFLLLTKISLKNDDQDHLLTPFHLIISHVVAQIKPSLP